MTGEYYRFVRLGQEGKVLHLKSVDDLQSRMQNALTKKSKTSKQIKVERPLRVAISREEAIKRMKKFPQRREQFLATARANKS